MKEFFFILIFVIYTVQIQCSDQYVTVFEKAFKLLHNGPPPPLVTKKVDVIVKWITQKVDNFNETDTRTWKMQYMENGENFKTGGPIFIFVGGEWAISPNFIQAGHTYDMAKQYNGYLFYTEHRYYGRSYPTEDLSVENLHYLSVDQSLADLAYFIKFIKKEYYGMQNSKVILVGGSYSASMVTWFQRIYPDLAAGSWASSAPLFAKIDFTEYKEIAGQSIALVGGQSCYDRILNGFKEIEQLFQKNSTKILKLFNVCKNFDTENKLDVWSFFGSLSDVFSGIVQTHNGNDIGNACKDINSKEGDLEGVFNWIKKYLDVNNCNDFSYTSTVESLNYTRPYSIMRQWIYQTCSEFGWYQTSGSKKQPFGSSFPVQLYTTLCKDVYGERFSNATIHENVLRTNRIYGGWNPNVTNVVMTHGQLDPWRAMGIQESNGESHVVPLYAHCKDFGSISDNDSEEMKASKRRVQGMVEKWLKWNN